MASMTSLIISLPLLFPSLITAAIEPRPLTWSKRSYGPDGPWQAVQVRFGTPGVPIDAYPGGVWESLLISPKICDNPESRPTCYAEESGTYNHTTSDTSYELAYRDIIDEPFFGTQALTGSGKFYFDALTIIGTDLIPNYTLPNLTTLVVTRGYRTLLNGTRYSAAVGNIALGAQATNMTFGNLNGSLLTGYLAEHEVVPSSSFGLHIGSASQRIPGSLWIGGYDQNRIVGPVSGQSYNQNGFPIDLLDISLAVAIGHSPFNFTKKTGLLAEGNSTLAPSLLVGVDPKEPYLYLPESTCRAIAAWLPITYDADLGVYLWNTQDPLYERIVASPAYLGFTFRLNNAAIQNMTVKVPFKLLNLTLTEPLAHKPTPYFPCSYTSLPNYQLGRSFLQAAFMGVNWGTDNHGTWWLAQAPGPNIGPDPEVVHIGPLDGSISESKQMWEDTWQGIWAPIAKTGEQPTPTALPPLPSSSDTGPSAAKHVTNIPLIAGVTAGAAALLIAVVFVTVCLIRRKRSRNAKHQAWGASADSQSLRREVKDNRNSGLIERLRRHRLSTPHEMIGSEAASEFPGYSPYQPPVHPVELYAGPVPTRPESSKIHGTERTAIRDV